MNLIAMKRNVKYSLLRLFRSNAGAHSLALGLAIGFFPVWFPTFGIGAICSIALAKLMRANIPAALISAGVGSFLWPVVFYLNYKCGALLFTILEGLNVSHQDMDSVQYTEPIEDVHSWSEAGMSFLAGATVNSVLFTVVFYYIFRWFFQKYQRRVLVKLTKKGK
ncbi:DUF2062 domain-containing protein [Aneurinibacillus sp. REN35]|uniref:DUF2062 domain-containing protein n=1 Tax=Aneurinibacillus sp. REN35 TaxID=3237286 RepID=UPI003529A987